ncbi:MAG TPA: RagB/SusD family nutrient uptake outer membrane protein [Flavisolibacter sp.]
MKKGINYFIAFTIGIASLTSCKKTVELEPTHTVNGDKFFTKVEDYNLALTGAYQRLKQNSLYSGVNGGSLFLSAVDIAADNFRSGPSNLGNLNTMFRWNYTADNSVTKGGWDAAYSVIQQTNLTLRGLQRFRGTEPRTVNRIEGQARALRAFMHFEIFRWWAPNYDPAATTPGIAYVDTFDIELKPARLSVQQSYNRIEADLKLAKAMLSNTDREIQDIHGSGGVGRAYIDTLVVNAMLARMYLYAKQWDSAVKYATMVINEKPLADDNEFALIWQDASTEEVIWSLNYEAGNAPLLREIYRPNAQDEFEDEISWRPVVALTNAYGASDLRGPVYFTVRAGGFIVPNKYFAKTSAGTSPDGVTNFKIFRTAEMYLIRAEAHAMQGRNVQGLADLNALRTARGASTGAEAGTALQTAIQTERRKELFVEGHRFFDLKRTTRTINRTQNCSTYCSLAPDNRAWALPIPQAEIIANPNIQQNPGY